MIVKCVEFLVPIHKSNILNLIVFYYSIKLNFVMNVKYMYKYDIVPLIDVKW